MPTAMPTAGLADAEPGAGARDHAADARQQLAAPERHAPQSQAGQQQRGRFPHCRSPQRRVVGSAVAQRQAALPSEQMVAV